MKHSMNCLWFGNIDINPVSTFSIPLPLYLSYTSPPFLILPHSHDEYSVQIQYIVNANDRITIS